MDLATGLWVGVGLFLLLLVPYLVWEIRRGKARGHTWFTWFKERGHSDIGPDVGGVRVHETRCRRGARRAALEARPSRPNAKRRSGMTRYRKGSGALCSLLVVSIHVWNSSAVWTVTNPRIRAWPKPQSCAQAIWYWNSAFPVRVRISAVVIGGDEPDGDRQARDGVLLHAKLGHAEAVDDVLAPEPHDDRLVHGQIELIDRRDVVLRGRIGAIESQGIRLEVEQLDVRAAEYPVGAGIVDVPGELLAGDLNDQRFALRRQVVDPARPRAGSRIRSGEPLRPRQRRSPSMSTRAT